VARSLEDGNLMLRSDVEASNRQTATRKKKGTTNRSFRCGNVLLNDCGLLAFFGAWQAGQAGVGHKQSMEWRIRNNVHIHEKKRWQKSG
jgi:hypothetical protein